MRKNLKIEIQTKASELFNQKGYKNTTMRDIASALNISLGNLTYHYHKKEDLMMQLLAAPEFIHNAPASTFHDFFQLLDQMLSCLMINQFFYTDDELGRVTEEFYRHNVDTVNAIEQHLSLSLQNLSQNDYLNPWTSNDERNAYAKMIMDSFLVWIKNSFYRIPQDQLSKTQMLTLVAHLLESHVSKEQKEAYKKNHLK